jgi:glyoxylate/hydroxypyruvate reductase A
MIVIAGMPGFFSDGWLNALRKADPDLEVCVAPMESDHERADAMLSFAPGKGIVPQYPNLKFIASGGAGVDGVFACPDLPPDLPIIRLVDDVLIKRMTIYVVQSVLNFHREARFYADAQTRSEWTRTIVRSPEDTRVGILGLGVLGQDAAEKLVALGFPVSGWSRTPKSVAGVTSFSGPDGLPAFLQQTDVLVSLLPLTPETRNIVNRETLAHLPEGATLINAGRGGLVLEYDVIAALDEGTLAGAALDVFTTEPLPSEHPFWKHPKIILTPHVASETDFDSAAPQIIDNLRRALAGEPLLNVVDRKLGY